jgi:hypothetical protein
MGQKSCAHHNGFTILGKIDGKYRAVICAECHGVRGQKLVRSGEERFPGSITAEINVGWAGGWDKYLIDLANTREETEEEVSENEARKAKGWGGEPVIGDRDYLRRVYVSEKIRELIPEGHVVKILRHLGGGD